MQDISSAPDQVSSQYKNMICNAQVVLVELHVFNKDGPSLY